GKMVSDSHQPVAAHLAFVLCRNHGFNREWAEKVIDDVDSETAVGAARLMVSECDSDPEWLAKIEKKWSGI
ncbi:MAG: hypothetical protein Q8M92_05190, partial [Candidatus Subteraquimicrobiales bacterium]|nr:hypothetical protein [Candidatus Subteraquimicrobiales bacterium]